jgi:CheY-like chemotaxis protein
MAKILLVEDDPHIADYVSTILLAAGHPCVRASTAARAREHLQADPDIALVLLDYHLGDDAETGHSLLTTLRTTALHRDLPVIICSADARQETVAQFLSLRVVGFLRKPFRPERLLSDVSRGLGLSESTHVPFVTPGAS